MNVGCAMTASMVRLRDAMCWVLGAGLSAACGDLVTYEPGSGTGGRTAAEQPTNDALVSDAASDRGADGAGPDAAQAAPAEPREAEPREAEATDAESEPVVLTTISAADAYGLLQDPPEGLVVLDVRTRAEFDRGHLAGAIQRDFYMAAFDDEINALDRDVPYLIYCATGGRSAVALERMGGFGFREVYEIEGGFSAWSAAGFPFET